MLNRASSTHRFIEFRHEGHVADMWMLRASPQASNHRGLQVVPYQDPIGSMQVHTNPMRQLPSGALSLTIIDGIARRCRKSVFSLQLRFCCDARLGAMWTSGACPQVSRRRVPVVCGEWESPALSQTMTRLSPCYLLLRDFRCILLDVKEIHFIVD